jgi:hypothetical protein
MKKFLLATGAIIVVLLLAYIAFKPDYWDLVHANTVCVSEQTVTGDQARQDACTKELRDSGDLMFYLKYG